jgi:predicted amidohydrolase
LRVAAVQFKADRGDLPGSRARLAALADAADADLVVLPEMAATGYLFASAAEARAVAEPDDGPTFRALREVCQRRGCWLVAGYPELAGERMYNSAMVIDPDGERVFTYRKTLLYEADRTWASPGDSGYRRIETPRGAFGVGICMDMNDPRFLLWVWRSRLDALAFPTNWVEEGVDVWPYWRERVGGSGAALVAANTWGGEPGIQFTGRSAVLQGDAVLASAEKEGDGVARAEVRPGREVRAARVVSGS